MPSPQASPEPESTLATQTCHAPRTKPKPWFGCLGSGPQRPDTQSLPWKGPSDLCQTQSLRQEETVPFGTLQLPQSPGHRHAPLRPFPPSLPLQAKNPGHEDPPEARPQLSPWESRFLCWQIRPALALRHNPNPMPNPNPNTDASPGCVFCCPSYDTWSTNRPMGGPLCCSPSLHLSPGGNTALEKWAVPTQR